MPTRRDKAEWQLTADALARLLAHLDPDPERGGERYETLRRTLVKFFDWRGAHAPDDCADLTLDRLARKLDSGETIVDVSRYALGIARLVFLEHMRDPLRYASEVSDDSWSDAGASTGRGGVHVPATAGSHGGHDVDDRDDEQEGLHACLERCLDELPPEGRALILQYYVDEKRAKIDRRVALAASLGLSSNALRSRASRLRDRLEQCVARCQQGRQPRHQQPPRDQGRHGQPQQQPERPEDQSSTPSATPSAMSTGRGDPVAGAATQKQAGKQ